MKKLTARDIVTGSGGKVFRGDPQQEITEVVIDSRKAKPGTVFFAIVGEVQDGHRYAVQAAQAGADILVLHDEKTAETVCETGAQCTIILTEDTTRALQDLAEWYLNLFPVKKIAVTGSTGKTTTKEMLYAVFSQKYKTLRTSGNFNNHIGLPLTIFGLEEGTEAAIFEMGMSEFGEIHRLADIVRPDLAVITNIGTSHIEHLKTRQNILKAKLEITDFFDSEQQILIINSDNDMMTREAVRSCLSEKRKEESRYKGRFTLLTAGEQEPVDFRLGDRVDKGEQGVSFTITYQGKTQLFELPVLGNHNGFNAMLAVGAGLCFGISLEEAAAGLSKMKNAGRRLQIEEAGKGIKLIDDTYNASPDSMMAAIDVLMSVSGQRKVAVLADVLEMGGAAEEYHRKIGAYAGEKNVDLVIAMGSNARFIAQGAEESKSNTKVIYYEAKEPLLKAIDSLLQEGDVVLVKGSNGMKMTEITDKIRSL